MSAARGLAVSIALALAASPACALDLRDIAATLGAVDQSRVRFVDVRTIASLGTPVERRGTLAYAKPSTLEMVVETPLAERLSIVGGTMTIESRGATRVVDLSRGEPLFAWIEGIRATLAGDEAALRKHFDPTVSGTIDRWTLRLAPRDLRLRSLVAGIAISGERERVRVIEVEEASGDHSVMTLTPIAAAGR
ncbi:MAG: LolA-related protein [Betaproteobacteria bacterium]